MEDETLKKYAFVIVSRYRIKIVKSLYGGCKIPSTISKECEIQSGHVSKLLKELKKQNIIECINEDAKKGRLYRLTDEGIKIADYMDN